MNSFLLSLKNYANFTGRTTRSEYWIAILFYLLLATLLIVGMELTFNILPLVSYLIKILLILFFIVTFIPTITLSVRRLHDVNLSGWFFLLKFFLITDIILLIFLCQPSDPKDNKYGPYKRNS